MKMDKIKTLGIRAGVTVLLLGLCFTVYHTQCLLDSEREIRFIDRVPVFLPNGKILKAVSMGHYTTLADYFWLHSVIYFGRRAIDHDNMYYLHMLNSGDQEPLGVVAHQRPVQICRGEGESTGAGRHGAMELGGVPHHEPPDEHATGGVAEKVELPVRPLGVPELPGVREPRTHEVLMEIDEDPILLVVQAIPHVGETRGDHDQALHLECRIGPLRLGL